MMTCPLKDPPKSKDTHFSSKYYAHKLSRVPHFAQESTVFMQITPRFLFPRSLQTLESFILSLVYLRSLVLTFSTKMATSCLPSLLVFHFVFLAMPFGCFFFIVSIASPRPPFFLHLYDSFQFSPLAVLYLAAQTIPGTINCNMATHLFS